MVACGGVIGFGIVAATFLVLVLVSAVLSFVARFWGCLYDTYDFASACF